MPASIGQRLLWLMEHYRGDGRGMLNQPLALRMAGTVDMEALDLAYSELVKRHESLRTTFTGRGGRLTQLIHGPEPMRISQIDLSSAQDPTTAAHDALTVDLRTPVDPTLWPVRATMWHAGEKEHVLCLNMHHLVTDDWSCSVLARDLGLLYRRARGEEVELPEVGWQFADWAQWQQQNLSGAKLRKLDEYWRGKLTGARAAQLVAPGPGADDRGAGRPAHRGGSATPRGRHGIQIAKILMDSGPRGHSIPRRVPPAGEP